MEFFNSAGWCWALPRVGVALGGFGGGVNLLEEKWGQPTSHQQLQGGKQPQGGGGVFP